MLNNEVLMRTSADVCSQIASYFQVVDNCIAYSDTNKQYCINPQTSYSPSPPIKSGSYTSVIISPNTHNTADIYNGFIRANLSVKIRNKGNVLNDLKFTKSHYNFNRIWFGFKDARDAIEKYEIVANGSTIYTQNNGCEESFLTSCCCNEALKRSDVFSRARHKDIWNGKFNCCGQVVEWVDEATVDLNIPLKIDLRRFLPLSNIKYLPAFAGKLELRLYFSCAGMVYCPLGPEIDLQKDVFKYKFLNLEYITNEFTPIGEPITLWTYLGDPTLADDKPDYRPKKPAATTRSIEGQDIEGQGNPTPTPTPTPTPPPNGYYAEKEKLSDTVIKTEERIFVVDDYEVSECSSIIPCFGISDNVYAGLVQKYSNPEHPLTFPTQSLSVYTTTKALDNINDKATITITPRFVDSIFVLFPLKHTHHTYFKNPLFEKFQLNCGGYGNIPSRAFATTGENPEFIEYCQNAMNMNNDQVGFNKEVVASLTNQKEYNEDIIGLKPDDKTSFFIGLPTETDNTYQQGLTSLSPINFEIIVTQNKDSAFRQNVQTPPLLCLLNDISISILVQPNGMPPSVRIGNYDLTTPE